jgi:hypothetical protein
MAKWEYLIVSVSDTGGSENRLTPQVENGKLIKNWQRGPDIYEYMNDLGAMGWELVTTDTALRYVFKRRKG